MQRLKGRSVVFGALAVLACSGDPTGNESTPTEITANPDVVFVTQGDSQAVIVSVVDEDGQILQAEPAVTNVGAGIAVSLDPTFQAVTTENPIRRQTRFFVKGVDLANTSFTITAEGLTKDIEVTSVPGSLSATVTDSLPALGDTVTLTAPPGTFFGETSTLTFDGAAPQVVSQDATQITFIPFPNIDGPAVITGVGVASNPALTFDLATPFRIKTDSIADIGTNVAPATPALGATVTLVLPTDLRLIPESLASLNIAGNGVLPRDAVLSPDSTTITFVPPPSADSFVVLNGIVHRNLPQYPLLLTTTAKVTTPVIDSIPANLSTTAPGANETVTLTVTDGSFAIDPTATVAVGADASPAVFSRTANSITFIPTPGSTGPITVTGVTVAGFSLTLPAKAPAITVGALAAAAGTDDPSTAPDVPVPAAVGEASAFFDIPDFTATVDHFYKINVPSAGNYALTVDWDIGDDIDAIVCTDVTCGDFAGPDPFDTATGDHPEEGVFALAAGDNYILVEDFGGADGDDTTAPATGATIHITLVRQ